MKDSFLQKKKRHPGRSLQSCTNKKSKERHLINTTERHSSPRFHTALRAVVILPYTTPSAVLSWPATSTPPAHHLSQRRLLRPSDIHGAAEELSASQQPRAAVHTARAAGRPDWHCRMPRSACGREMEFAYRRWPWLVYMCYIFTACGRRFLLGWRCWQSQQI